MGGLTTLLEHELDGPTQRLLLQTHAGAGAGVGAGGAAPGDASREEATLIPIPRGGPQLLAAVRTNAAAIEAGFRELNKHMADDKIVLHVGSGAAGRDDAFARLAAGFARLSPDAAGRLVLEYDERGPVEDVLPLTRRLGVPVGFDVFHHELAPSFGERSVREVVRDVGETWGEGDGRQELHFSTQEPGKRPGAHAERIDLDAFGRFVDEVGDLPVDCIVEVNDKERSVLRAQELLRSRFDLR